MQSGHVLTIIGIAIGTVLTATQVPLPAWLTIPLVLFVFLCLWASVVIGTSDRCARLQDSLTVDRYAPLYHRMGGWLTDRALGWIRAERPQPDSRSMGQVIRGTVGYPLLDRALLIAVVYPLLLLVLYWGLSGDAARLGDYVVVPAADAYWKHAVTLGGLAAIPLIVMLDRRAGWVQPSASCLLLVWREAMFQPQSQPHSQP